MTDAEEQVDSYRHFRHLRRNSPVLKLDDGPWQIARYDDVLRVLRDSTVFSSDVSTRPPAERRSPSMLFSDAPIHNRLRKLVSFAFKPAHIESQRALIQALRVAGARTDGTTLAWVGPRTIAEHIVPTIAAAAEKAGRAAPRIIATLPICVTEDPAALRRQISTTLSMYGQLPSYRAMFDREGVSGPGDLALVGSASEVEDGLAKLKESGVTDYAASVFATSSEEHVQTRELLCRIGQIL